MNVCPFPHAQNTVEETLNRLPAAISVFQALKTSCVGCFLARFCTLEYAAQVYGLDLQEFLDKLHNSNPSLLEEQMP